MAATTDWQDHTRPHEMWPEPEGWHPHYIEDDHAGADWDACRKHWNMLRYHLTDLAHRVEGAGVGVRYA